MFNKSGFYKNTKLEISKILEKIEINKNDIQIIKILDNYHSNPKAHVIGITGPPGVGKSSIISKLINAFRKKKLSVGVIAIDPSSKRSGGAILGDRARFEVRPDDKKVFVRSMAAKDYLGGISELTFPSMVIMRSIFDILIIETVGVGQSETNIENVVDTVMYCVQPASGDSLQFIKSGIIEIPDIIAVTKSDLSTISNATVADLNSSKIFFKNEYDWDINILAISAHKELGIQKLLDIFDERWTWLKKKNVLKKKRFQQDLEWIKKSTTNQYGYLGLNLIKDKIKYDSEPFKYLHDLFKQLKISLVL